MSRRLKASITTVLQTYSHLEDQGVIRARTQSGYHVTQQAALSIPAHYADQVRRMRAAVAEHFPEGTRVSEPQGGFVLWVELPAGTDAWALFNRAMAERISVTPGVLFSSCGKYRNAVRLNAGHPRDARIEQAVATVGRLAAQMQP